jgi:putative tryptophan/tyrosine transport system substrate-binding protein
MMRRTIELLITLAFSLLVAPLAGDAQPAAKVWRIGYLTLAEVPRATWIEPLRELCYVDGQTARFEIRTAQNDLDRPQELAADLVRTPVDIIVAVSPPAILAAKQATTTIPVVMAFWGGEGLIESGVVASFAQPGGNITGVYMLAAELDAKRFELLLQAVPKARTVSVLNPGRGRSLTHLRQVAETHRIQLFISDVLGPDGYDTTFAAMSQAKVDAMLVPSFPRFFREHLLIIEAAAKRRTPAIDEWGDIARAGGLMAYGPVLAEINQRAAYYVDRILKGTKPADLPVEQPTQFELVINLKTAQALGLTIPPTLLFQADEVLR